MQKSKVLLFDLGGVIVRWVGLEALGQMTGLSRDEVGIRFAASPTFQAYEIGQCDDDIFAAALIADFDLDISSSDAKALWNSWVQESYPGTKEILTKLREKFIIACLSNTNALHWGHLPIHIKLEDYFDHSYASHLIKAAKPNLDSYQIPIKDMDVSPENIWFFDDTIVNVEAARIAGMHAYHVDRNVGVIPTLQNLGLIS